MKKILYGVCGIGNGHAQRQLPIIEHLSKNNQIIIFAFDTSFNFYSNYFKEYPSVTVLEVAVPFYVGNKAGIDFEATEKLPSNNKDYEGINNRAVTALEKIGIPDIVITDYEPISAKYAYKHGIPLITIDQQSKYLVGKFITELNGQTYVEEVARLKMFFPTATARIACSFFQVKKKKGGEDVLIVAPIIKESVLALENIPSEPISILIYLSSQKEFPQSLKDIANVCLSQSKVQFHIFSSSLDEELSYENVTFYEHGDKKFNDVLKNCSGIISTAGHTLLSEAMYLSIPVYTIPLSVYEQQMNAEVIDKNGFGIKSENINEDSLKYFISNLDNFRKNILNDKTILIRGNGKDKIIDYLISF